MEFYYFFLEGFLNKKNTFLDIACGCGAVYKLINSHYDNIFYTGIDYSSHAIELAKKHWEYNSFFVKDYKELTKDYIYDFDIVHAGALTNVLPDGDKCLDFLLKLQAKNLILTRMLLTEKDSNYTIYKAYNEIDTCLFYHNRGRFFDMIRNNNYTIVNSLGDNYLLRNRNV